MMLSAQSTEELVQYQSSLTLAIIGHLVGDYLLQNDWMALNKKKPSIYYRPWWGNTEWKWRLTYLLRWVSIPCFVHCLLWTLSVMFFAGWCGLYFKNIGWANEQYKVWFSVPVFSALFATHFIQDRTQIIGWWMRLKWKDQSKFAEPPMAPWSLIVVDNVWHIVTIWAVWRFIV